MGPQQVDKPIAAWKLPWYRLRSGRKYIHEHYSKGDTGLWIEGRGFIKRLLGDDSDGSRHQRFIVQSPSRQSLLIAHNIDLADRVPVGMGDRIQFRGMYEWNELGGLVHWTHHDPLGVEDGGWIRYRRKAYA